MAHTACRCQFQRDVSNLTGTAYRLDIYQMIGKHHQDNLKVWDKPCNDEKSCGMMTKKEYDAILNERLNSIKKSYTGKNERLVRSQNFFGLQYNKPSNMTITAKMYNQNHYHLQTIYNTFYARVRSVILKPPSMNGDNYSWMLFSAETVPMYCSEGEDFTKKECLRMIGHALQKGYLWMPKEMQNRRLSSSSPDYLYFAIVRKDAKSDPERVPLQKNLEASKSQFKELLRKGANQKYELGIMGHSSKKSFGFKFPTNLPKIERSKNEMA